MSLLGGRVLQTVLGTGLPRFLSTCRQVFLEESLLLEGQDLASYLCFLCMPGFYTVLPSALEQVGQYGGWLGRQWRAVKTERGAAHWELRSGGRCRDAPLSCWSRRPIGALSLIRLRCSKRPFPADSTILIDFIPAKYLGWVYWVLGTIPYEPG